MFVISGGKFLNLQYAVYIIAALVSWLFNILFTFFMLRSISENPLNSTFCQLN